METVREEKEDLLLEIEGEQRGAVVEDSRGENERRVALDAGRGRNVFVPDCSLNNVMIASRSRSRVLFL